MLVVTGYGIEGYKQYGKMCLDSFFKYWPKETELAVYSESAIPLERGENIDISRVEGCLSFLERHNGNSYFNGTRQMPGKSWKKKDLDKGYSFRYDALKFCKMAFYARDAARHYRSGLMVWLDGDVLTYRDVPHDFIPSLLPDGKHLSCLGREPYHSETGFVLFKLPEALPILESWAGYYQSDRFIGLQEFHSAFVFDVSRKDNPEVLCHNLSPDGKKHVWFQTPLGDYTDHLKGKRKAQGFSPERLINRS